MRSTVLREPDLPPLPDDWRHSPVETLAETNPEVLGAATPQGFVFRYIDLSAVEKGQIDWSLVRETVFREAPSRARRPVRGGDVLFGTVRPALQSHGAIPADEQGPLVASTGFAVIRARPEDADGRFLFHSVLSDLFSVQARRTEVGSNYPAVNESDVRTFLVPHPAVREQRRIAAILDTLDDAIRRTEQVIAKLQQLKQGLLHDLLTRGVDENGDLRPPPSEAPHLYKDSPLGRIPGGWDIAPLETLCSASADCPHSTPEYLPHGVPCIRTADMVPGRLLPDTAFCVSEATYQERIRRLRPIQGDIIYSREGERLGIASSVGDDRVCLGQRVMHLRPGEDNDPTFLLWVMNSRPFLRQAVLSISSTTSPHINVGDVLRFLVARPTPDEQKRIGRALACVCHRSDEDEQSFKKLRTLKSGLLHDLLTGRVRVPLPPEVTQ
jgi:type I restriction enzyme, S subunit